MHQSLLLFTREFDTLQRSFLEQKTLNRGGWILVLISALVI
jgi:hypothetical protein